MEELEIVARYTERKDSMQSALIVFNPLLLTQRNLGPNSFTAEIQLTWIQLNRKICQIKKIQKKKLYSTPAPLIHIWLSQRAIVVSCCGCCHPKVSMCDAKNADPFFVCARFEPFYGALFVCFNARARACVWCTYSSEQVPHKCSTFVKYNSATNKHSHTQYTDNRQWESACSSMGCEMRRERKSAKRKMFQLSWISAMCRRWRRVFRFNWTDDDERIKRFHAHEYTIGRMVRNARDVWRGRYGRLFYFISICIIFVVSLMFTITMRDSARLPQNSY